MAEDSRDKAVRDAIDPVGNPDFWLNEAAFCDAAAELTSGQG